MSYAICMIELKNDLELYMTAKKKNKKNIGYPYTADDILRIYGDRVDPCPTATAYNSLSIKRNGSPKTKMLFVVQYTLDGSTYYYCKGSEILKYANQTDALEAMARLKPIYSPKAKWSLGHILFRGDVKESKV